MLRSEQRMAVEWDLWIARREFVQRCEGYRGDPVGYAREVVGATLTGDQEMILDSVRGNRRTAVKASHAIGKTYAAALACCWWYDCWERHIAYITAPTWGQALGLTFKQVRMIRNGLGLPGELLETGWLRDEGAARDWHFARAMNAESGEGFQGEHTAPILIVSEESVGVPGYIARAAEGLMTNPACRTLALANPTEEGNWFGAACEDPLWSVLTCSVLDHPNIAAELECLPRPYPDAVSLTWLYEMLLKECEVTVHPDGDAFEWWGLATVEGALAGGPVGSNATASRVWYQPNAYFQGRALGEFPTQPDEQVIPKGWLSRLGVLEPSGVPEVGCDVARHGKDRTAIATRWGPCLMALAEVRQMSLEAVTGSLVAAARAAGRMADRDERTVPLRVDVTGGLGAGPCDAMAARGYAVEGVNSSEAAIDRESYPNRRSELWFDVRERARARELDFSRVPRDMREKLARELSAPRWDPDAKGRKVVEAKKLTKRRLGLSPDLADAVNLAYARGKRPAGRSEVMVGGRRGSSPWD